MEKTHPDKGVVGRTCNLFYFRQILKKWQNQFSLDNFQVWHTSTDSQAGPLDKTPKKEVIPDSAFIHKVLMKGNSSSIQYLSSHFPSFCSSILNKSLQKDKCRVKCSFILTLVFYIRFILFSYSFYY